MPKTATLRRGKEIKERRPQGEEKVEVQLSDNGKKASKGMETGTRFSGEGSPKCGGHID